MSEEQRYKISGWFWAKVSEDSLTIKIPKTPELQRALAPVQLPDALRDEDGKILQDVETAGIGQSIICDEIAVRVQVEIVWPETVVAAVQQTLADLWAIYYKYDPLLEAAWEDEDDEDDEWDRLVVEQQQEEHALSITLRDRVAAALEEAYPDG
jgi:hypothetical protein